MVEPGKTSASNRQETAFHGVAVTDIANALPDEALCRTSRELLHRLRTQGIEAVSLTRACGEADAVRRGGLAGLFACLWRYRRRQILWMPRSAHRPDQWLVLALFSLLRPGRLCLFIGDDTWGFGPLMRLILRLFHPPLFFSSQDLERRYAPVYPGRLRSIPMGVDTRDFTPVDAARKAELRSRYGLPADAPLLLHVGHLTKGRNLDWIAHVRPPARVVLAASSFHRAEPKVLRMLEGCPGLILLRGFQSHIAELYQACDAYVFAVREGGAANAPLSALEAMACNLPLAAVPYGELAYFQEDAGLRFVRAEDPGEIARAAMDLPGRPDCRNREKVLLYDWDAAAQALLRVWRGEE